MPVISTITALLAASQVVLSIYDNYYNSNHRMKQRELEKKILEDNLSSSLDSYKKLCELKNSLQIKLFEERINNSRKLLFQNFKATANHESERSKEYPLRIPSFALVDNIILNKDPNLFNDSNTSGDNELTNGNTFFANGLIKPLKVIVTPILDKESYNSVLNSQKISSKEAHLLGLVQTLNDNLDEFFCEFYNCGNTHQIILFSDIWTNISIKPIFTEFVQLQSFLQNEPTVIVHPLFDVTSNTLSFKIYYWGITENKEIEELALGDMSTFKIDFEDTAFKCVEDMTLLVRDTISLICDAYMWYQYRTVPFFPVILKEESRLSSELINFYDNLFLKSIINGVFSPFIDINDLINYVKTIDTIFEDNKCMFSLFAAIKKLGELDSISNNYSLIEPSVGVGWLIPLLKELAKIMSDDSKKNIASQVRPGAINNNQNSSQSTIEIPIVSPKFNYAIWRFSKINVLQYELTDDFVHQQYINYVQSVLEYQVSRHYELYYAQNSAPWLHSLMYTFFSDRLSNCMYRDLVNLAKSILQEISTFGAELNQKKSYSQQTKLFDSKACENETKLREYFVKVYSTEYLNNEIKETREYYFNYEIFHSDEVLSFISGEKDKYIIKDELTDIIGGEIGEVSYEVFSNEQKRRYNFIKSLFDKISSEELESLQKRVIKRLMKSYDNSVDNNQMIQPIVKNASFRRISRWLINSSAEAVKIRMFKPSVYEDVNVDDKSLYEFMYSFLKEVWEAEKFIRFFINSDPYVSIEKENGQKLLKDLIDIEKRKSSKKTNNGDDYDWKFIDS